MKTRNLVRGTSYLWLGALVVSMFMTWSCGQNNSSQEQASPPVVETPAQPAAPETPPETPPAPPPAPPPPPADEPWRTKVMEVDADTPCPETWWLVVKASSVDPTLLSGPINKGYAREADDGGLQLIFANFDLPTDPTKLQWAAAREDGQIRASFVVSAGKNVPVKVGTYGMGEQAGKLRLSDPGVGYDFPDRTGGVGWAENEGPTVEVTLIDDERICGRVAIDDTYNSVRGAFSIKRLR